MKHPSVWGTLMAPEPCGRLSPRDKAIGAIGETPTRVSRALRRPHAAPQTR